MDAQSFLKNFGYIAGAPNGVKRLREVVLQLAVQGKLAPQYEMEEFASELIKKMGVSSIEGPAPFELPEKWVWVKFFDVFEIKGGSQPPKSQFVTNPTKNHVRLFQIRDFGDNPVPVYVPKDSVTKLCSTEDVMMGRYGASVGKVFMGQDGAYNVALVRFIFNHKYIHNFFVFNLLKSPYFQSHLIGMSRSAQAGFNKGDLAKIFIPLPPIEEQKRIVTKVDELMALCDKLEAQQQKRQRLFPVLSRTTHARLVQSPTPANLKAIFDETETVSPEDLRKTILNLAIRGRLIRQSDSDGTADDFLDQLSEIQQKVKRKSRNLMPLPQSSGTPFPIPKNWKWCRLGQLAEHITSGSRGWAKYYSNTGAIFLTMGNLSKDSYHLRLDKIRYVRPPKSSEGKRTQLQEGDIIISITGDVGNLGLIPKNFGEAYINQHTCLLRLHPLCRTQYFAEYLRSDLAQKQFNEPQRGIKNSFRLSDVAEMLVPVPPFKEQLRIVNKISQLMTFVDLLEELQNKKNIIAQAFAQASVTAITGTQIKEQEKMKAPKTELVTKLQIGKKPKKADQSPLADFIAKHKGRLSAKSLWQQSDLKIDAFYQQLKIEMANGWIIEPEKATMQEVGAK